jgi:ABC-2 type transport system permease protein
MLAREVRILFRKEWRQLLRSKGALLSSLLLPALMIVVIPVAVTLTAGLRAVPNLPEGVSLPPALAAAAKEPLAMVRMMLPLFIGLGGLVAPMVAASYTLITEREQRTLELLVALPVRIEQVLMAKLLALVVLIGTVSLVLFSGTAVFLLAFEVTSVGGVFGLAFELVAGLSCSTGTALMASLLAKDFRTANNLSGIVVLPALLLTMGLMLLVPNLALGATLLGIGYLSATALTLFVSLKVITVERLLR